MSSSTSATLLAEVSGRLEELIHGGAPEPLPPSETLDQDEERCREVVNRLLSDMQEVTLCFKALAQGQIDLLDSTPDRGNILAGPLKELHSRLRELTWQAQQVAKGDYKQRISFLGDFSEAFNTMVETLDSRERSLRDTLDAMDETNRQLRESQEKLQTLFDSVADVVLVTDHENRVVNCNILVLDVLGYRKDELIGRNGGDLFVDVASVDVLASNLERPDNVHRHVTGESFIQRKDGTRFPALISVSLFGPGERAQQGRIFVISNITKLKEAETLLREQAIRDPLTGLFNRREALDLMERSISAARRHHQPLAVSMCDLDNFKDINDTHGHPAGDHALKRFTMILRECMRREDLVGRYGGDEFVIIFPNSTAEDAMPALNRVVETLQAEVFQAPSTGKVFRLTASFGIACMDSEHRSGGTVLDLADQALYEAKRRGGGCISVAPHAGKNIPASH